MLQRFLRVLLLFCFLGAWQTIAFAQGPAFVFSDESGDPGSNVVVDIDYTDGAGLDVSALTILLSYNSSILTPQTTSGNTVDGCLSNIGSNHDLNSSCEDNGSGTITLTILPDNLNNPPFVLSNGTLGTMTFAIDGGASPGTTDVTPAVQDEGTGWNGSTIVELSSSNVSAATSTITITGIASGTLTSSLPFGDQAVGDVSGTQSALLTSTGTEPLNITNINITSDPNNVFSIDNGVSDSCTTGTEDGSCNIGVTCTPAAATTYNSTLLVVINNSANLTSSLSCTGVESGPIITPSLTFRDDIGATPSDEATLEVIGTAALEITQISFTSNPDTMFSLPGGASDECSVSDILDPSGDASCEITVQCTAPTGPASGVAGTLEVQLGPDPRGTSTQTVTTDLLCIPNLPNPSLTPDPLTLSGPVGVPTGTSQLTLSNSSGSTVGPLTGINAPTGPSGVFNIVSTTCGDTLDPGQSCTIDAQCTPTSTPAASSYTVSFDGYDDPEVSDISATLRCEPEFAVPDLQPDPQTLSAPVGETATASVTLSNSGDTDYLDVVIPGQSEGGLFSITGNNCPDDLGDGSNCSIEVECTVGETAFNDTLNVGGNATSVQGNDGNVTSQLICQPLFPAPELDPEPELVIRGLLGDDATEQATLSNTGDAPLEGITIPETSTDGLFTIGNVDCPVDPESLGAGASCAIDVTCTIEQDEQTDTLVIDFDNADSLTLELVCTSAFPVPTLTPWGLALLIGLLGFFGIRRRIAM